MFSVLKFTSTPTPDSPDPTSTTDAQESTAVADLLSRLIRVSVEALNNRDYSHASPSAQEYLSHISSKFQGSFTERLPGTLDFPTIIHALQTWMEEQDLVMQIRDISVDADVRRGSAKVLMNTSMVNGRWGIATCGQILYVWKRRGFDRKWLICSVTCLTSLESAGAVAQEP